MITLYYRVFGSDPSTTLANETEGGVLQTVAEGLSGRAYDNGNYWVVELPDEQCELMWRVVMQEFSRREAKLLRTAS